MTISRSGFKTKSGHGQELVKAANPKKTFARLMAYLRPQGPLIALVLIASVTSSLLALAGPYLLGLAIDQGINHASTEKLIVITGIMLLTYILNTVFTWVQNHFVAEISNKAVQELRNQLFSKVMTLPVSTFDKTPSGELMSRMINDVQNIGAILGYGILQLISGTLSITGVILVMFWLNWRLAIVTTLTVPIVLLIIRGVAFNTRRNFKLQQENMGILNSHIEENITGLHIVRVFGQERAITEAFYEKNRAYQQAATKAQIYSGIVSPLMSAINNASYAIVVGFGGYLALSGAASIGAIASFVNYSRQFSRPVNQMASLYNSTQSALAGAERVFELMDTPPEEPPGRTSSVPAAPFMTGHITFKNVFFHYDPNRTVLENICFQGACGKTTAIVGPTGSGKTTLINLLIRFYDPTSGTIAIGGSPIDLWQRSLLRQHLAVVLQDTWLLTGSVMENIRFGRLDASDEDVMTAAKTANADGFIRRLPKGYDTILTEDGGSLSQGQRQMIAIARAVLANPDILILDEATSNVDTRTEVEIQKAMRQLMKGRTSFVIAHRLRTILDADRILVIDNGRILEAGTHQELLDLNGMYSTLYHHQFELA